MSEEDLTAKIRALPRYQPKDVAKEFSSSTFKPYAASPLVGVWRDKSVVKWSDLETVLASQEQAPHEEEKAASVDRAQAAPSKAVVGDDSTAPARSDGDADVLRLSEHDDPQTKIEAVGAGDVPRDRLIELAKEGAKRLHEEAWTHPSETNHGHAINLKANDLGFSDCSHRDCELVRLEATFNAAFAAMQKLMFPSAPPPPKTT